MKDKKIIFSIIGGIVAILLFIFVIPTVFKKDEWSLIVCKSKVNNSECYENSYTIPGFSSAQECLSIGKQKFMNEGFECVKDCKTDEYGLNVCDEICNVSGCID
ncbi:MAG: hypothetical protein AB1333_00240 [Patescibacteria group bacterium]